MVGVLEFYPFGHREGNILFINKITAPKIPKMMRKLANIAGISPVKGIRKASVAPPTMITKKINRQKPATAAIAKK